MPDEPRHFFVLMRALKNLVPTCMHNGWTFEKTRELVHSKILAAIPDPGEPGHDFCWSILARAVDEQLCRTHRDLYPET